MKCLIEYNKGPISKLDTRIVASIKQLLNKDPHERPSASEALQSTLFSGGDIKLQDLKLGHDFIITKVDSIQCRDDCKKYQKMYSIGNRSQQGSMKSLKKSIHSGGSSKNIGKSSSFKKDDKDKNDVSPSSSTKSIGSQKSKEEKKNCDSKKNLTKKASLFSESNGGSQR